MRENKCKKCGKILYGNSKSNLCEACLNKRLNAGKGAVKVIGGIVLATAGSIIGLKKK